MDTTRKRTTQESRSNIITPTTAPELPTQDNNYEDEEVTECPQQLPYDLNIIKEFIQHDKDDD